MSSFSHILNRSVQWIRENPLRFFILGMASFSVVGSLCAIYRFPIYWGDEAGFTEPGWTFLREGHFGYFVPIYGMDVTNVVSGRLHLLLSALVFYLRGWPDVEAVRFISWGAASGCVFLSYLIGKKFYDKETGLIAASLTGMCSNIFWSYRDARPELLTTFLFFAAVTLFLIGEPMQKKGLFFLSGFLAGITMEEHLNGSLLLASFLLAIFIRYRWNIFRQPLRLILAGAFLSSVIYIVLHFVIPTPALFFNQWGHVYANRIPTKLWVSFFNEYYRYKQVFWDTQYHRGILLLFFFPAGLVWAMKESHRTGRFLLMVSLFVVLALAFIQNIKTGTYAAYLFPFFLFFVARWLVANGALLRWGWARALLLILSFYFTFQNVVYATRFPNHSYRTYSSSLVKMVPPKATIFGELVHWPAFYKDNFVAIDFLQNYFAQTPQPTAAEFRRLFNPAQPIYFFVKGNFQTGEPVIQGFVGGEFIKANARLVGVILDPFYIRNMGDPPPPYKTLIYRMD